MSEITYIVASQRRSGSMFMVHLLKEALGMSQDEFEKFLCIVRISRGEPIYQAWQNDKLAQFVQKKEVDVVKLEDPGWDSFAADILSCYPKARWIASFRPIEDIITSHYNIRAWGERDIATLVSQWQLNLDFLSTINNHSPGSLLLIDLKNSTAVTAQQFADFLGVSSSKRLTRAFKDWQPVNTLADQWKRWGEEGKNKIVPGALEGLHETFPEIRDCEHRYQKLQTECNRLCFKENLI